MTRRNTGPTQAVRDAVYLRDGMACVVGGCTDGPFALHHRSARRMGGSRLAEKNSPSNLILVCDTHHRWIELNRAAAENAGLIVRSHQDPATTPLIWHGSWSLLTDMGAVEPVEVAS